MRPSNIRFSVISHETGKLRSDIKRAFLGIIRFPSRPLDYILEGGILYQVHYKQVKTIRFDSEWNWSGIVSFQTYILPDGSFSYHAVVRPYSLEKPSHA